MIDDLTALDAVEFALDCAGRAVPFGGDFLIATAVIRATPILTDVGSFRTGAQSVDLLRDNGCEIIRRASRHGEIILVGDHDIRQPVVVQIGRLDVLG